MVSIINPSYMVGIWSAALFYNQKINDNILSISIMPYIIENLKVNNKDFSKLERIFKNVKSTFGNEVIWYDEKNHFLNQLKKEVP